MKINNLSITLKTNYEVLKQLCEERKSTRIFSEREVSQTDIEKIRQIALTTPYASGKKSFDLLIIKDKRKIKELSEIIEKKSLILSEKLPEEYQSPFLNYSKSFVAFDDAPVLFVPTFRVVPSMSIMLRELPSDDFEFIKSWERDNFTKSISAMCTLILLAAQSLNLASCYMTGALIAGTELNDVISVKKGQEIAAIIPIGYPKEVN